MLTTPIRTPVLPELFPYPFPMENFELHVNALQCSCIQEQNHGADLSS